MVVKILSKKLTTFEDKKVEELIKYALLYPPRVRALLGAILEKNNTKVKISALKESLNPITTFELDLKETDLPTIKNWYII